MTQSERAEVLIAELLAHYPELGRISEELRVIVGEAQNGPPQGQADGSIDAVQWKQLSATSEALSTLLLTLLFHGRPTPKTYQPEVLSDDELAKLLP